MMYNIPVEGVGVWAINTLQYRNHFSVPNLMIEFVTQITVYLLGLQTLFTALIDKFNGKV